MNNLTTLNNLLQANTAETVDNRKNDIYLYAQAISTIENVVVVVSDLLKNESKLYCGLFGKKLGVMNDATEYSIWEKGLLAKMSEQEQDSKYLSELRFFHFIKKLPKSQRSTRYLATKLRFTSPQGDTLDVLHRLYYIYNEDGSKLRYAICVYGPLTFEFSGKSLVIDSLTGRSESLTDASDHKILGKREIQVLTLISRGLKSHEIAEQLSISKHTVSRHRQEILTKLQVKNSIEACRSAKALHII